MLKRFGLQKSKERSDSWIEPSAHVLLEDMVWYVGLVSYSESNVFLHVLRTVLVRLKLWTKSSDSSCFNKAAFLPGLKRRFHILSSA